MKGFSDDITAWRSLARETWARTLEGSGTDVDIDIPPYFIDRYAYRAYKKEIHGQASLDDASQYAGVPDREWSNRLCRVLVGAPSLGILPVNPNGHIPNIPLLEELLHLWRTYLSDRGVQLGKTHFQNPVGKRWMDFYKKSVHYPNPPAIRGPTFVERLSPEERVRLVERVGIEGVLGLYIFLSQTHEEVHLLQTGEPMMNEVHLAWLWCGFLDVENLWWWQRSEYSGESFNIEYPWVSKLKYGPTATTRILADSYLFIRGIFKNDGCDFLKLYDSLCELAWIFDHKKIKYRDYLNLAIEELRSSQV